MNTRGFSEKFLAWYGLPADADDAAIDARFEEIAKNRNAAAVQKPFSDLGDGTPCPDDLQWMEVLKYLRKGKSPAAAIAAARAEKTAAAQAS